MHAYKQTSPISRYPGLGIGNSQSTMVRAMVQVIVPACASRVACCVPF